MRNAYGIRPVKNNTRNSINGNNQAARGFAKHRISPVPVAYLGIILIWSTTPLAISWSIESGGFLFGILGRFSIASVVIGLLLLSLRRPLPLNNAAIQTYLVGSISVYGAMITVYWAVQFIPSGWISVLFGLAPILTGLFARIVLGEDAFAINKVIGMTLGLAGLALVFATELPSHDQALLGIIGCIVSVSLYSGSSVLVKKINAEVSGIQVTAGSLWISTPAVALTWMVFGEPMPESLSMRTLVGISYLGVIGSVLGFSLYYYVLGKLDASRVALMTLITPISGLLIGHWFNAEPLTERILIGAALIVLGLAAYELKMLLRLIR